MTSQLPHPIWRLLGDPSIIWEGRDLTPSLGKKAVGLIAYLALAREGAGRDELARLLWPPAESTRELARAKHSLRQCLVSVRKAFGDAYETVFEDTADWLKLRGDAVAIDVQRLTEIEAVGDSAPAELAELCRGPFLRSLATRSRPFDEWADAQRLRLVAHGGQMLEAAHGDAERSGDRTLAAKLSDAMHRIGHGYAHLPSVELHPGEIALPSPRPRRRWASHLAAGLGALVIGFGGAYVMSSDLRAFIDDTLTSRPPPPPVPDILLPRLAVLPFQTRPGTDENIGLGIKQDVENGLQQISELIAISPAPKVQQTDLDELASRAGELGVRYLIYGSVRGDGQTVEIDVRCFDAITRTIVWSEQYEEDMAQGYNLSKNVTLRILNELNIPITTAEKSRIEQLTDTDNVKAWLAAAKGLSHLIKLTPADVLRARKGYEEALTYDTDYCSAHRGLAWINFLQVRLGRVHDLVEIKDTLEKAKSELGRCRNNPEQAQRGTTLSLSGALLLLDGKYDEAVAAGEAAIADLPNSPDTHAIFAHTLTYVGQHERALTEIERAMGLSEIHPAWYRWTRGRALRMAGRFDESAEILMQDYGKGAPVIVHLVELTASLAAAGRISEARQIAAGIHHQAPNLAARLWLSHPEIHVPEIRTKELEYLTSAGL